MPAAHPDKFDAGKSKAGESVPMDADGDRLPDSVWVKGQRKQANAAGVGLQFGLTICLFAYIGLKLDQKFDTSPWILVAGVLLGFVGGTISLLKKFK